MRRLTILAGAGLMLATAALAQSTTDPYRTEANRDAAGQYPVPGEGAGAGVPPTPSKRRLSATPDDLSVQAIHNYAACVVDTDGRAAQRALAADGRAAESHEAIRKMARGFGRCAPGSRLRFNQILFTGGLAERLLTIKIPSSDVFVQRVAYDASAAPVDARMPSEVIGICTVRAVPARVWALFQTEPATDEEGRAMQQIGPSLMGCVAAGQHATFNRPALRALLALAAYRITQPAIAPAQGR